MKKESHKRRINAGVHRQYCDNTDLHCNMFVFSTLVGNISSPITDHWPLLRSY